MNCVRSRRSSRGSRVRACRWDCCWGMCDKTRNNRNRPAGPLPLCLFLGFFVHCLDVFCLLPTSRAALFASDVLAERSWRSKPELSSDACGELGAAGGDARLARPGGVRRASPEQHTAATRCPTPVPATDAAAGKEHSTCTGQRNHIPGSRWHGLFLVGSCFQSLTLALCVCVFFSLSAHPSHCSLNKISLLLSTTPWWSRSKMLLTWCRSPPAWPRILDPTPPPWLPLHGTTQLRLGLRPQFA